MNEERDKGEPLGPPLSLSFICLIIETVPAQTIQSIEPIHVDRVSSCIKDAALIVYRASKYKIYLVRFRILS